MRILILAAAAASVFIGSNASAAPAAVQVQIGPELQAKAETTYGLRDVRGLADELRRDVEKRVARSQAYDGARIELTLTDATPNRPTFKQLGDVPGLSFNSFGVGGAAIEGRVVSADGHVEPLAYRYYETDVRNARHVTTWSDAEWTFQQFADRLARGKAYAKR